MKYKPTPNWVTLKLLLKHPEGIDPLINLHYHGDAKSMAKRPCWWVIEMEITLENDKEIRLETLVFTSKTKSLFSEMRKDVGDNVNKLIDRVNRETTGEPYEAKSAEVLAKIVKPV